MTFFSLTRPLRRMLQVPGLAISQTTCRNFRRAAGEPPSFHSLFCWVLILSVSLLMVPGCGRYKEELESAKQQIEKLNSEVKELTEQVARLNQEKSRLSDDLKTLSEKNTRIQRELDDLNKARVTLSAENREMTKKYNMAQEEITSLNRDKKQLAQEVEELKKRVADVAPPTTSPATIPTEVGRRGTRQLDELNPCEAVLAYMKASEGIVRQQKGTERTKLLEQAHQQYAPRMKGAPENAIKAAETWVKEGTKFWDKSADYPTFRLLQLRNTVLDACGKSPSEAGF